MNLTYAVDKHNLPYNPFTGTALTVKKRGAPPVDRSEFFVTPEQFRCMMNDPLTSDHVKMMILLAYTTGTRSEEFLDDRYGKSSPRIRQRARQAHIKVSDMAMGDSIP